MAIRYDKYADISDLLAKKALGLLNEEEAKRLEEWIASSEKHQEIHDGLVSGSSYADRKRNFSDLNHSRTLETINDKIRKKTEEQFRLRMIRRMSAVAAVLVLLLTGGVWLYMRQAAEVEQSQLLQTDGRHYALLSVDEGEVMKLDEGVEWQEMVEKSDAKGQEPEKRASEVRRVRVEVPRGCEYRLRLNDSTEVCLNSETVLEYPEQFEKEKREVFLRGEAFFAVNADPAHPFEVRTEEALMIRVTGTQLNVRNYTDEQYLRVTLLEGKVSVGNESEQHLLMPSEQAVYDRASNEMEIVVLDDPSVFVAWKEGMFAFEQESLVKILETMGQWYGVEFVLENRNAIVGDTVTFHALRDDSVEELLEVLRNLVDFTYRSEGNKIYIRF